MQISLHVRLLMTKVILKGHPFYLHQIRNAVSFLRCLQGKTSINDRKSFDRALNFHIENSDLATEFLKLLEGQSLINQIHFNKLQELKSEHDKRWNQSLFSSSNSLRLNAPNAQRVRFAGTGGYDHQLDEAKKLLSEDKVFTVDHTEVFKDISYVILKEFPEHKFNTVMFLELEPFLKPQKSVQDIYIEGVRKRQEGSLRASESFLGGV